MLERELESLKKYKQVNDFLKKHDWLFISPIYFQGFELNYFFKLSKEDGDHKEEIAKWIFRKLYNLSHTASFIDGYCRRCSHIEPFLFSIEHSLILTFQRDYEGGIKTLIPIIEGILRRYLNVEKGIGMESIGFKELRKSFLSLKSELIAKHTSYLSNPTEFGQPVLLSEDEVNYLIELETQYYDQWFSFVIDFVDNSFYLNTRKKTITNEVNRHAILHEYGLGLEYNLENYIKIYFVHQFLTWIFLRKENKSQLNEIGAYRYFEKVIAYRNIIKHSERLIYDKHILYRDTKGYNSGLLRRKFKPILEESFPQSLVTKYYILRKASKAFWNRFGVDIPSKVNKGTE